jgi:hypothetical protein
MDWLLLAPFILLVLYVIFSGLFRVSKATNFEEYQKEHPDMCPFITKCKTFDNLKCHGWSHKKCETFKKLEWR